MKTLIFLFLSLPFLALAENSFKYSYNTKFYEIVSVSNGQYELWEIDKSTLQRKRQFNDKGNVRYTKDKLVGIYDLESNQTPYFDFQTDINSPTEISKKDFTSRLDEIAGKGATKLPAFTGTNTDCDQIKECQGETGQNAYSCLYNQIKIGKERYSKTECKNVISVIGQKSFAPLIHNCNQEAVKYCGYRISYDMYECLSEKKNLGIIPNDCKGAIDQSRSILERMSNLSFPTEVAQKPTYGFGAKPMKTGFSPSGSGIQIKKPKSGIR